MADVEKMIMYNAIPEDLQKMIVELKEGLEQLREDRDKVSPSLRYEIICKGFPGAVFMILTVCASFVYFFVFWFLLFPFLSLAVLL